MDRDVADFIEGVTTELSSLSGKPASEHHGRRRDRGQQSDGSGHCRRRPADRHANSMRISTRSDRCSILRCSPAQRTFARPISFSNREQWLAGPSVLFDLLVQADRKYGTRRSNHYYEMAMHLAHVTAATDLVPSVDEIAAIDAYRTRLLQAMDAAGVARPGQPDQAARSDQLLPQQRRPACGDTASRPGTGAIRRGSDGRARCADRPRECQGRGSSFDQSCCKCNKFAPSGICRSSRPVTISSSPAIRALARRRSLGC